MAHHVQKKAAKKHNACRPRKSRPSDIFRTPPSYPALPDIPWMTKLDAPSGVSTSSAGLEIAPTDDAASLASKVAAAGGPTPEEFVYNGVTLTTTLADCGLAEPATVDARIVSK